MKIIILIIYLNFINLIYGTNKLNNIKDENNTYKNKILYGSSSSSKGKQIIDEDKEILLESKNYNEEVNELKIEEIILKLIIVKNQIEIADDPKKQKIHSRNFNRLTKEIKYIGTIEKHLFKKEEMKNLAKLIKKLNKNEKGKLILKKFYLEEKEEIEKMCENFRKGLSVNEHVNFKLLLEKISDKNII
uniref:Uncharacterized protein n=1 Tax=Meloidogyne enterolobii TaxID=390850 RepID=A0A6V7VY01_MELEN|nr:unnamed protein product [Meloidogyne enterolobii]